MNCLERGEQLWLLSRRIQQHAEQELREVSRGFDFYPVAVPTVGELNPKPLSLQECGKRAPRIYEVLAKIRAFSALINPKGQLRSVVQRALLTRMEAIWWPQQSNMLKRRIDSRHSVDIAREILNLVSTCPRDSLAAATLTMVGYLILGLSEQIWNDTKTCGICFRLAGHGRNQKYCEEHVVNHGITRKIKGVKVNQDVMHKRAWRVAERYRTYRDEFMRRPRELAYSDKIGPTTRFEHVIYRRVIADQLTFLWFTEIIEESQYVAARLPKDVSEAFLPYVQAHFSGKSKLCLPVITLHPGRGGSWEVSVFRQGWKPLTYEYADRASAESQAKQIEPMVRHGEFTEGEKEFTPDDWHRFFAGLRTSIDPLDFSYNVGWWCLKLLWAEAWFRAEQEFQPRSWKMHGESRVALVQEIRSLIAEGQTDKNIAEALEVAPSTLRSWRKRYRDVRQAFLRKR